MADSFTDILRMMRLSSSVYFREHFAAPWGMAMDRSPFGQFHLIAGGQCWLQSSALTEPCLLSEGDVVLFPTGAPHSLSDSIGRPRLNGKAVVEAIGNHNNPFSGDGVSTDLICGHFEFDESVQQTFACLLPTMIIIRRDRADSWLDTVVGIIMDETQRRTDGGQIVAERLAEGLFIEILRQHASQDPEAGLVVGLADPTIRVALDAMHAVPGRRWTIDTLAKEAGTSRTALAVRFKKKVGVSPIEYLTSLRMTRALQILRGTDEALNEIAEKMGYSSEASFIRAFKKRIGETPGRIRRKAKSTAS